MLLRFLLVSLVAGAFAGCGAGPKPSALPTPSTDLKAAADGIKQLDQAAATGAPRAGTLDASEQPSGVIDLDTIRIRVVPGAPGQQPTMTSVATADLFNQAVALHKAGEGDKAAAGFRQLIEEFPESNFAPVALFNIAAIADQRGDMARTLDVLRELNAKYPNAEKSIEGHLYIVALLTDRDRFAEALEEVTALVGRGNLSYTHLLEAHARKGYIELELGKLDVADATFDAAIAAHAKIPRLDDPYFIAMAHYYKGEVLHRRFWAIAVQLPDDQLRKDLDRKEALAGAAYDQWKIALRYRDAYWATAAGYQMSQIFVEYWRATVTAPYPRALSAAARPEYVRQVHQRVRHHMEKALEGHQLNVELGAAYGVTTIWANGSKAKVVEIVKLLADEDRGVLIGPTS